jgi:hypothetical protein
MALRLECLSVDAPNGCRLWTGNCVPSGYPLVGKGGHGNGNMYAHRAAYELAKGPIPKGHEMHHTCGNVRCINPDHLVAVTKVEHSAAHRKPACPKGHAFTPENTYTRPDNGARTCKQCRAAYMRGYFKGT